MTVIGTKIFSENDQNTFARLSGDFNPIHVDHIKARRLIYGEQVVHGVHTLIWSIDCYLNKTNRPIKFTNLYIKFIKPVFLNKIISCGIKSDSNSYVEISIFDSVSTLSIIKFDYVEDNPISSYNLNKKSFLKSEAFFLQNEGDETFYLNETIAISLFTKTYKFLNKLQLALLLTSTRIVGMKCPGMDSLFSELDLSFNLDRNVSNSCYYQIEKNYKSINLFLISISGDFFQGKIKAFKRPLQSTQKDYSFFKKSIDKSLFNNQRALIIGGSRGLGEMTAKILAAGGAEILLTYHKGFQDAENLKKSITEKGGKLDILGVDVLNDVNIWLPHLEKIKFKPTHLYYFATPKIIGSKQNSFDTNIFKTYIKYYVESFYNISSELINLGTFNIFYPSTIFIEENNKDFLEYVLAKKCGEEICHVLLKQNKLKVFMPRLPPLRTDQTASILNDEIESSEDYIISKLLEQENKNALL
jgi:hypothetical protein